MLISMNWIQDFVDLKGLDLNALIHRFTLSTAEVEEIIPKGQDIRGVVTAKILSVENHPNSKKLHLLKVDTGETVYPVVCGAPNVRTGMIVAFVKEGGMAGGMEITAAPIAGEISYGMCCSEQELGISADHSGIMDLPADTPLGIDLKELYAIEDLVFEVDNKSLTNRPDLWGHYGIAREFAAISGRPLKTPKTADLSPYQTLPEIGIKILDPDHCFRYSGIKIDHITVKTSPTNLRIRLFYCGTRAINLLADLTNYLMLEYGQPMHAFDRAKVDCIEVQRFPAERSFQTLDGEERSIDPDTLMITAKGEPVAIAGVMGGLASEIEDDTTSLLLESANFDAVSIRKTSTRLGLRTDASMRYEKTLDPEMTVEAIARFLQLLSEIDGGARVVSRLTDVYPRPYPKREVSFDLTFVRRYTGIDIDTDTIQNTLQALGFGVALQGAQFHVDIPTWRATKDVTMSADLIEEISRIYGYDNFVVKTTRSPLAPVRRSPGNFRDNACKDLLVQGYHLHEINSYLWQDSKKLREIGIEPESNIRLLNAMTPEHDTLRNCIVPSLLTCLPSNRSYGDHFGLFEIARVVEGTLPGGDCNERKKLGIVLYSRVRSEHALYDEMLEILTVLHESILHKTPVFEKNTPAHPWQHPVNTAQISAAGIPLGFLATLHPSVTEQLDKKAAIVTAQLDMDQFAALPVSDILYRSPSKYPGIDLDLTLLVKPDTSFAQLAPAWDLPDTPLQSVSLFDIFQNQGQKNLSLRFVFQSHRRTLSMEEVQPVMDQIIANFAEMGISIKS